MDTKLMARKFNLLIINSLVLFCSAITFESYSQQAMLASAKHVETSSVLDCTVFPLATVQQDCTSANATITVTPVNPNFRYSIDNINYQVSNVFTVAAGNYSVSYRDISTICTSAVNSVTVGPSNFIGPPAVTTPIYYCQNSTAVPLTATALPGASLRWYANAAGGPQLPSAPTPSTASVGNTSYYVSQWNGTCESTRAAIVVRVVANTGGTVNPFCDGAHHTPTSVAFDWNNVPGYLGYNWSYSINGGPLVFGSQVSPSHIDIPVPGPNTNVVFTIISVIGLPCVPSATATCSNCTTVTTPNFPAIAPLCAGGPVPVLANTSPNGVTGTWSPATISNTVPGNYTFTPNVNCADPQILAVAIKTPVTPTFAAIAPLCQNATPPVLPLSSTNTPPITGTWNSPVSTATPGTTTYTFTPTPGQCVTGPVTLNIDVDPTRTPNFAPIPAFCAGTTAPILATTSPNGITGTWSPATISNTAPGRNYIFTPSPGQCGVPQTLNVVVTPTVTPNFAPIPDICSGAPAPILSNTSPNGVNGTWSPAVVSNTVPGNYTFTPTNPCGIQQNLSVQIKPRITPTFNAFPNVCRNATSPVLPLVSLNNVSGTWSPPVSTSTAGIFTYTFTPSAGQCTTGPVTATLEVLPVITPNFPAIAPFCAGTAITTTLDNTSPNGVTGTWNPSVIDNMQTRNYLFTPTAGQCALPQVLTVTVIQPTVPTFAAIAPFCSGSTAPLLPLTSLNGISGTFTPAIIDNLASGNYTFTPDAGICATTKIVHVTVVDPLLPDFPDFEVCLDAPPPTFNLVSPNGIPGTWLPATVDTSTGGNFPFVFTPNVGECALPQTIQVTINEPTLVSVMTTVSNAFSDNPTIAVIAAFNGEYLYQLDHGPLQESPIFEHVSYGLHTVTVVDRNGCSSPITENDILVVDYPKFFTPNGDGFNDTWNIFGIEETLGTKIFIFDRYGKLLKQMSPDGNGWDGTYNGQPLPASDYWFAIDYNELTVNKNFKAHFSLKR